ncbi:MarR family winged helix-turn-helix transcriptional regulator [Cochlodiniinecator piscidefendens]|uniref:MarR family winged helix-turn-helix transcriptional regulator n=1 Tax=Cochlodiniinecator piscidefendens TaxID=2715756 RepID=UPI00140BDBCC|nr:MarR family transcriptional regulator [Cochlodiniinecator piscidefendens]
MSLHTTVFSELNRRLSNETSISLAKFDTMAQLYRFPDGISMSDLSSALRVSNGNVSGLVNRLIKDGYVCKEMSREDRRSFRATLTEKGRAKFEEALDVHQNVLADLLGTLSPDELSNTASLLRGLAVKLNEGPDHDN